MALRNAPRLSGVHVCLPVRKLVNNGNCCFHLSNGMLPQLQNRLQSTVTLSHCRTCLATSNRQIHSIRHLRMRCLLAALCVAAVYSITDQHNPTDHRLRDPSLRRLNVGATKPTTTSNSNNNNNNNHTNTNPITAKATTTAAATTTTQVPPSPLDGCMRSSCFRYVQRESLF